MSYLPYAVAAWICLVGLAGVATSRNLIHLAICLMVTQSSSYVLLLSVINEDIMPGYALVLGAMLLAGLWFDRPTQRNGARSGARPHTPPGTRSSRRGAPCRSAAAAPRRSADRLWS